MAASQPSTHLTTRWRDAMKGALLCGATGLLLGLLPLGQSLALRSYDLAFAFRQTTPPEEVVLVYLDEQTYDKLKQRPNDFDRGFHAELLAYLTEAQAKLVVFDFWFDQADLNRPASDEAFAKAIRRHGNVVLGGGFMEEFGSTRLHPWEGFRTNAAAWGVPPVRQDRNATVRQCEWRKQSSFALPWVAAARIKPGLTNVDAYVQTDPWLNYYGPPDTLLHVSYMEVTNRPSGFFKDRCVFVGSRTVTQFARQPGDQFSTPYTEWHDKYSTGVEILATAFLNLVREESLHRLPLWTEIALIVLLGGLAGLGLGLCRPLSGAMLAGLGAALVAGLAIALVWSQHLWFPWLLVVVQIACGGAWVALARLRARAAPVAQMETLPHTARGNPGRAAVDQASPPRVADHTLLRRIGQGAYGEVWLARNAVGMLQAVKIVYRREFSRPEPYEREFRGIEKFMPISRSHPGFVHLLHVGRNEEEGWFYYMMELGDDVNAGPRIDPATYVPKTLASALRQRGALPVAECVELGLALSAALDHLHQNKLVHRDLKPSNILFVNQAAKLADIGLVTDLPDDGQRLSQVGTPGFIPPEGPGSPGADVYGLGKLLYEASLGWEAERFPELPTELDARPDQKQLLRFHEILWRACEPSPTRRYASAAALHADLLQLRG